MSINTSPPVFVLNRDLPEDKRLDNYDMCLAVSKVVGREGVLGAQRIGSLQTLSSNANVGQDEDSEAVVGIANKKSVDETKSNDKTAEERGEDRAREEKRFIVKRKKEKRNKKTFKVKENTDKENSTYGEDTDNSIPGGDEEEDEEALSKKKEEGLENAKQNCEKKSKTKENTDKEAGGERGRDKQKEKDIRDFLERARSLSCKRP
ncbi:hypothetical protein ElyMa_003621100 [Elysia marginata]|uniref:Uncharacterized protein n=1 Tax=Elysia marginata TaxID=1093978 RepID=A0AAV4ETT6_9GAST|nr:hypothetical protein ElyMa_003621100 [Elysia marginata]